MGSMIHPTIILRLTFRYVPEDGDHVVEAAEWVGAGELDVRGLWPQFQLAGVAVPACYLQRRRTIFKIFSRRTKH